MLLASVALLAGWTWQAPHAVLQVPVLMFHRVGAEPVGPPITDALTVPTAVFATQMEWLRRDGFHAIGLERFYRALEGGAPLPRKPVLITFDDGYRDVLWNAAPILHQLHMPAADFVITGRVSGADPSFLTWPEVRDLQRLGFTIGSHTVHHLELTLLDSAAARYELYASRLTLFRRLHHAVRWFAYPAGRFDARVVGLVRKAGYRLAFTTLPGDLQRSNAPYLLHRDEILDTTGVRGLEALLKSS